MIKFISLFDKLKNKIWWHIARLIRLEKYIGLSNEWKTYKKISVEILGIKPTNFCLLKNPCVTDNKTIWVYWRQGLENAPIIVRKCIQTIKEHKGEYEVILLTEDNVKDYVKLTERVEQLHDKKIMSDAHYSDLIRTQLLIQYGGIWIDATCYLSENIPDLINEAPFFMFSMLDWDRNYSPIRCSNWFIKSEKDNKLLISVRDFLFNYWEKHNCAENYFIYHIVLSALINSIEPYKRMWDEMPFIANSMPHYLLNSLSKPYSHELFCNVINTCFVHKLTYKYDKSLESQNTILSYILQ